MKLNCCLLATTAVAQFDYNPNAEYETDYNPDNSIARGQKFIRPSGDVNQFGITNALSDQLSSLAGDDAGDIDFSALAALLLERGNGPRPARTVRKRENTKNGWFYAGAVFSKESHFLDRVPMVPDFELRISFFLISM